MRAVSTVRPGVRRCSRNGCAQPAVATLTYVYADSTAVLGPLATVAEPHCYDLCGAHSQRLTAPRGWEVVRLAPSETQYRPSDDDLLALADAVRESARPLRAPAADVPAAGAGSTAAAAASSAVEVGRRGHLRVLRDPLG